MVDELSQAADLGVNVVLEHRGVALSGGIWRLDHCHSVTYVFATALGVDPARRAVRDGQGESSTTVAFEPTFLEDRATGVTLVSATVPTGGGRATAQLDVVEGMLGRCVAAELLAELAAGGGTAGSQAP